MSNQFFEPDAKDVRNEGVNIDFKRIGYRALRFWYVIVFFLLVALTIAFLRNRYSTRIYPVTASIIIREKEETSGGEFVYKNALIDPYRNYLNEPYIIRSYPLIGRVIEDLNFEVAFYQKGNIKTTEMYSLPIKAKLLKKNGSYGVSILFEALDENRFSLKPSLDSDKGEGKIFAFNDSIEYLGHHLIILKKPGRQVREIKNSKLLLTFLDPMTVTSAYVNALGVQWAEEGAGIINLSIQGSEPNKAIDFMTGLITTYQQYDLEKKNRTAERTIQFIKGQLANISDSLHLFENQLEVFKEKNSATGLDEESQRLFEKLGPMETQRSELVIRQNYYVYLENYIRQGNNLDLAVLPTTVGVSDPVLSSLVEKMIDIQLELKLFIGKGKDDNPLVNSGLKRLNEIKNEMLESVKSLRETDKFKMDYLNKQIAAIEAQINRLPMIQRQLISIQRNYSLLENIYIFLMQKMSEAAISKASNVSDIALVNPPMQGGPISPKPTQNYAIALIFGLVIPFVIFVLIELFNTKIQSKEDVEKMSSIPFVGGVGHNGSDTNLIVRLKPKSGVAESFRALRSNLNYFTSDKTKQVFMVNSSISGEGKTFTTVNLATVFALSGKRTLIVGADMRRPKMFDDFGRTNTVGLSTFLSAISDFDSIVQDTEIENLFLVSGGPVPPNPSELLLTDRFPEFIKQALEKFDYVIIDTPPMALVTDAFVISKFVNHTVFVVRQNYTPKEFVRSLDEYYCSGKLKNMSILLNDIYRSGPGYGYGQSYAYQYGYGYGRRSKGNGYYED